MCKVMEVKSNDIFPVIVDLLNMGKDVVIPVNGKSMYPFLNEPTDSVELTKRDFHDIKIGDIVVARLGSGRYIMHRVVVKKRNMLYIMGDAQHWIDGPVFPEQVIACVTAVYKRQRKILCKNMYWVSLSYLWLIIQFFSFCVYKSAKLIFGLVKGKGD